MSEKLKTALSSVLAVSLVVSVMTASGFACLASVNNDDDFHRRTLSRLLKFCCLFQPALFDFG